MKLRKRSDGELAELVVEYTRKAARAISVVQDVQREQRRREMAKESYLEKQARFPWPCQCGAVFSCESELAEHRAKCTEAQSHGFTGKPS